MMRMRHRMKRRIQRKRRCNINEDNKEEKKN